MSGGRADDDPPVGEEDGAGRDCPKPARRCRHGLCAAGRSSRGRLRPSAVVAAWGLSSWTALGRLFGAGANGLEVGLRYSRRGSAVLGADLRDFGAERMVSRWRLFLQGNEPR